MELGSKDTKSIEKPNRTPNPSQEDTYDTLKTVKNTGLLESLTGYLNGYAKYLC